MKRKLLSLLMALVAVCGVQKAYAYSTDELVNSGWTKVTELSNVDDYYYMFVDAGTGLYSVSNAQPETATKPSYQRLQDPAKHSDQLWKLVAIGDGNYRIQSYVDDWYFYSPNAGWSDGMSAETTNSSFSFEVVTEGTYSIRATATPEGQYVGPWNDGGSVNLDTKDNWENWEDKEYEDVACNKGAGNSPDFYIYSILRDSYVAPRSSTTLENEGWTKVETAEGLGLEETFYTFVDLSEEGYESGVAITGTNGRPIYTANADPLTTTTQLWTLQAHNSGYALKNFNDNKFLYCSANWDIQVTENINTNNTDFIFAVTEGKWTLSNAISTEEFVGRWQNSPRHSVEGEGIAANKAAGKGKKWFYIYSYTVASELPAGEMESGKWYYFDIDVTGQYQLSSNTGIVYTKDQNDIRLKAEVTNTWDSQVVELESGRYYVKSSTAQTLSVDVYSYTYIVGDATTDKTYIQPGQTVTITYAEAQTNDPGASLDIIDFSGVTFGGNAISVTPTANGFTFTVPEVTVETPYDLTIPANAIGYNGQQYNGAQTITLKTPAIFDTNKEYYLSTGSLYLSRGANYGTRAAVDKYGLPVKIETNDKGETTIQFMDNNLYLFQTEDTGNNNLIFTDNSVRNKWIFEQYDGGYAIKANNGIDGASAYLQVANDGTLNATSAEKVKWSLVDAVTRNAQIAAYPVTQKANVLETAGIDESELEDCAFTVVYEEATTAETFSKRVESVVEEYNAYNKQITGLTPGLYKVSMNAFHRTTGHTNTAVTLYNAGFHEATAYMYANDEKVRVADIFAKTGATTKLDDQDQEITKGGNTYYIPTDFDGGEKYLNAGHYGNELYVNVGNDGILNIGINIPSYIPNYWLMRNGVKVEQVVRKTNVTLTMTSAGWATLILPFAADVPDGLTAYTCSSVENDWLVLEEAASFEANTPYIVEGTVGTYEFSGISTATETSYTVGNLTGVFADTPITSGYVLQNGTAGVGFYAVDAEDPITVTPYRVYVPLLNNVASANLRFLLPGDETAVDATAAEDGVVDVYHIGGTLVKSGVKAADALNGLPKGIYVVDGKKVMK